MVKRKQPDFQPKQLRVGKHLPKGRNVTNTSFKAKKIFVKDQNLKLPGQAVTLEELLKDTQNQNVARKIAALRKVSTYIERNEETLSAFYPEILHKLKYHLLDSNAQVRQETIEVISNCLEPLSTSQMNSSLPAVTTFLNCMMTHIALPIRRDSLILLSSILSSHPSSICNSVSLLRNLLNMISSVSYNPKTPCLKQRKLSDNLNSSVTSIEFRNEVLKIIIEFLESLVNTFAQKKTDSNDERVVHYDGKHELYLSLYAGGGLNPKKLQVCSRSYIKSEFRITMELHLLFEEMINIFSDIITEETAVLKSITQNAVIKPENIRHLNTVTQALCCFCDWYNLGNKLDDVKDVKFKSLVKKLICEKLMKGFAYSSHESSAKRFKVDTSNELNLGIVYLYTTYILPTEHSTADHERDILICMLDILEEKANFHPKSLYLIVKILRNYIDHLATLPHEGKRKYLTEVSEMLVTLRDILKTNCDKEVLKEINSLFMDLALNFKYKFLLECEGITSYIEYLFYEMGKDSFPKKYDERLLKFINQICGRRYPAFINILNSKNPMKFVEYLLSEDYQVQYTAINFITNMTTLPVDFLQNLCNFILEKDRLEVTTVSRLIRMLHVRFTEKYVTLREYIEFALFLFNLGIDCVSLEEAEEQGYELIQMASEYQILSQNPHVGSLEAIKVFDKFQNLAAVYKDLAVGIECMVHMRILPPTTHFKRNMDIAKVCLECLSLAPEKELILQLASGYFKEILNTRTFLPMHTAVALFKLASYFYDPRLGKNEICFATDLCDEILISSVFYTSFVMYSAPKELLKNMGVLELERELNINQPKAIRILETILPKFYENGVSADGRTCLHVMRFIKFLYNKMLISVNDMQNIIPVLQGIAENCHDNTPEQALLIDLHDIAQNG